MNKTQLIIYFILIFRFVSPVDFPKCEEAIKKFTDLTCEGDGIIKNQIVVTYNVKRQKVLHTLFVHLMVDSTFIKDFEKDNLVSQTVKGSQFLNKIERVIKEDFTYTLTEYVVLTLAQLSQDKEKLKAVNINEILLNLFLAVIKIHNLDFVFPSLDSNDVYIDDKNMPKIAQLNFIIGENKTPDFKIPYELMEPNLLSQQKNDRIFTKKNDIYVFGVLAYELLFEGANPFPSDDFTNLVLQTSIGNYQIKADTNIMYMYLLWGCLLRDPTLRFDENQVLRILKSLTRNSITKTIHYNFFLSNVGDMSRWITKIVNQELNKKNDPENESSEDKINEKKGIKNKVKDILKRIGKNYKEYIPEKVQKFGDNLSQQIEKKIGLSGVEFFLSLMVFLIVLLIGFCIGLIVGKLKKPVEKKDSIIVQMEKSQMSS